MTVKLIRWDALSSVSNLGGKVENKIHVGSVAGLLSWGSLAESGALQPRDITEKGLRGSNVRPAESQAHRTGHDKLTFHGVSQVRLDEA